MGQVLEVVKWLQRRCVRRKKLSKSPRRNLQKHWEKSRGYTPTKRPLETVEIAIGQAIWVHLSSWKGSLRPMSAVICLDLMRPKSGPRENPAKGVRVVGLPTLWKRRPGSLLDFTVSEIRDEIRSVPGVLQFPTVCQEVSLKTLAEGTDLLTMDGEEVVTVQEKDPRYPMQVLYCGVCGMPPELCEYNTPQDFDRCKPWLAVTVPEMYPDLKLEEVDGSLAENLAGAKISKSSAKDGKESKKKKRVAIEPEIVIQKSARKGRKQVTIVYGLDLFGMKIPEVAKVCKKKFSCGASAVKAPDQRDTLEIQGDRMATMAAFLRDDFKVPEGRIFVVDEDKAKVPAFDVLAESAG